MEEEHSRHRCTGDDGASVTVVEYRHVEVIPGASGTRIYPGARRHALTTGQSVRYIDKDTFEVIGSGELLRRQL